MFGPDATSLVATSFTGDATLGGEESFTFDRNLWLQFYV
jgi:hypothetical protein